MKFSENIFIKNFSKFLLKIAIVFKVFESVCPFLSLTVITGQLNFSSLADGLLDRTPEEKMNMNIAL